MVRLCRFLLTKRDFDAVIRTGASNRWKWILINVQASDSERPRDRGAADAETLMKRTPIIAALVLSAVSTTIAQQQSVRTRDAASTEQAVQQQDQERIRAQIAADTIALRRIYADDFFGIGPTGVVRNKAEVIADFTSHALTYQSITTAEVRVRVYGNTAVETGRSTMVGQDRGKAVPRENRFTRVWVMTDGRWQLVANHYSLMTTQSE